MNNKQYKKIYAKPELYSLGNAKKLTLQHHWNYSYSRSSSYSESGGDGHEVIS